MTWKSWLQRLVGNPLGMQPHLCKPYMVVEWEGTPFKNARMVKPYWICKCGKRVVKAREGK